MRLLPFLLSVSLPLTALGAQNTPPVERRVDALEKQMRSVQRRVFRPGEAIPDAPPAPAPAPVTNGLGDLTARIDALERQLAAVTGQVEENGNRIATVEAAVDARLDRLEAAQPVAAPQPLPEPLPAPAGAEPQPEPAPAPDAGAATPGFSPAAATTLDPVSTDPAENLYLSGYRLWEAKRYDEAAETLKDMAGRHPKHRRASWARNLLGRTYLDSGKPATAAETFLANYQELPAGDRAADSLFYLGAALMKLGKPQQACKVYDELRDMYGTTMRDALKAGLPAARREAKCG